MRSTAENDRARDNRGTGIIVAATAASAFSVLVFQAVASRTLGTNGFAPIAVLWTVVFLLFTVLMLPAEQHLTRALVVTRTPDQIRKVRRDAAGAFGLALVLGLGFVALTLTRFFNDDATYLLIIAAIVATRSLMSVGRGTLAGHRRFAGYGATIALEAGVLLTGGIVVALTDGGAIAFAVVMAIAPLATLAARPFASAYSDSEHHLVDAQPGTFLVWLVVATAFSQMIIAGGPIAVSFIGGGPVAVSIFFTSFALLRGPVTSAYNLVARVLPDFTELAQNDQQTQLWRWAHRITLAAGVAAILGAIGSGLLLIPIVETIYGQSFSPPVLAAVLGGAGVGLGLGALFVTQVYSAAALGSRLALGWFVGLIAATAVLVVVPIDPISRVALAFAAGEGTGLVLLGLVLAHPSGRRK
ncbi:MAG: hypothetical protein BMS9Abin20_0735 [Acidimicrobiia bacterium]|nr:MAG: hypothetical protein BMS9Abin20_0735 [Acidimicrobiia bacterium]